MKSFRWTLNMNTPERVGFVNITSKVEEVLRQSGIREGLCLVNAMHITASVFINDDEPGLHRDYAAWPAFYGECDGRRVKRALVKIIGE